MLYLEYIYLDIEDKFNIMKSYFKILIKITKKSF